MELESIGTFSGWHLEYVLLRDEDTGEEWMCTWKDWYDKKAKFGIELIPDSLKDSADIANGSIEEPEVEKEKVKGKGGFGFKLPRLGSSKKGEDDTGKISVEVPSVDADIEGDITVEEVPVVESMPMSEYNLPIIDELIGEDDGKLHCLFYLLLPVLSFAIWLLKHKK